MRNDLPSPPPSIARNTKLIQSAEIGLDGPLNDRQHREANDNDVSEA